MAFAKFRPVPAEYAMNVVLYCRYSSDKQTENSIDGQLRANRAYCDAKGFRIVGEYIDRAMSGTTDVRPEFQRMIKDAKKRQFAFVIVYRFDRFSRDRYDSAIYKKQLEACGVRVLSVEESIGTGDEGIILEAIYEAMAEGYSRTLSRVVTRGMRETAMKGLSTGGNIPIGYKIEEKHLVIDETTAPAILHAFEQYSQGKTKTQIADELNNRGFRTKNKKLFDVNSVTRILQNKMYYGNNDFGDIKRECPAIVSPELFKKVQDLLFKNKKHYGRKVAETYFALSGKLFCGHCGASMIGDSGTARNGTTHYYYTCQKRKKSRSCNKKSEKKDYIEWYVCEQTVMNVLTDENIQRIAEKVAKLSKDETEELRIAELESQLSDISREIDAAAESLMKTNSPSLIKRINEKVELLEAREADIRAELTQLQVQAKLQINVSDTIAFLRSFKHGDFFDDDFRRRLINTFINCIYLYDDKVVIYFNIKDMKEVSHIEMISDLDQLSEDIDGSDSFSCGSPLTKLSEPMRFIGKRGGFGMVIKRTGEA